MVAVIFHPNQNGRVLFGLKRRYEGQDASAILQRALGNISSQYSVTVDPYENSTRVSEVAVRSAVDGVLLHKIGTVQKHEM